MITTPMAMTYEETAAVINRRHPGLRLTRRHVQLIERRALRKIRRKLEAIQRQETRRTS